MGILFLKYLSEILQIFALTFWSGGLIMIVFILTPYLNTINENKKLFNQLFIETIHKLEYVFIFAIIFLWSGILIYITSSPTNPFKSKLYILYILLSGLLTIITLLKVFWIQHIITKSEKSIRLFPQNELQKLFENKLENYKRSYYFLSVVNFLIIFIIILLNQFGG